ncbi:Protein of unknown function DUF1223 [Macleaya cordata]|uniref:Thioredoxin-like fold n=1 Tax=Macleaya cordata TaxID=56857 RepID=A0A200QC37_MACCD|nr:Protein of unknown function DUF1223 [Macleaya cordata]
MGPCLLACFGRQPLSSPSRKDPSMKNPTTHHDAQVTSEFDQMRSSGGGERGPILVELFSSQGCATSPEAELLISRLGRGDFKLDVPVIFLAFHVDYWDYLGWKDPFGSSQWTVRQKAYVEALRLDTMFTPQVVVQGRAQCVGIDDDAILSNITSAVRFPAPTLQATFKRPSQDTLKVCFKGALRTKVDSEGVDVMVALYENGLVTNCSKGDNKDLVLSNNYVVRRLDKLCNVKDISAKKTITGTLNFSLWEVPFKY